MSETNLPSAEDAIARYQEIRDRLPEASFPAKSIVRNNLQDLCDDIDCFVLDGFGVLNVGADTVPGAVDRINTLRAMGKELRVLTNGATFPATRTCEKYKRWGMEFAAAEVISSRDALAVGMKSLQELHWGFSALPDSELPMLAASNELLGEDPAVYDRCDGCLLYTSPSPRDLSTSRMPSSA